MLSAIVAGLGLAACRAPHATVRIGDLSISQVVAASPVVLDSLAGTTMTVYLTIANRGATADTLTGVTTPLARSATLHTMACTPVRMVTLAALPIGAGSTVRFRPGGLHVMLAGLLRAPPAGDSASLVLAFRRAGRVPVVVRVVRLDDVDGALK